MIAVWWLVVPRSCGEFIGDTVGLLLYDRSSTIVPPMLGEVRKGVAHDTPVGGMYAIRHGGWLGRVILWLSGTGVSPQLWHKEGAPDKTFIACNCSISSSVCCCLHLKLGTWACLAWILLEFQSIHTLLRYLSCQHWMLGKTIDNEFWRRRLNCCITVV